MISDDESLVLDSPIVEMSSMTTADWHQSPISRGSLISRDEHAFFFASNILVKTWVRHQYVKHLPIVACLFVAILWFSFVADYMTKVSQYINGQSNDYNCTVSSLLSTDNWDCSTLDRATQYFTYESSIKSELGVSVSERIINTMDCTLTGANFYYPKTFVHTYQNDYYLVLFINVVVPFLFTYVVIESIYLGWNDCLIIQPEYTGHKSDWLPQAEVNLKQPDHCYAVGWHFITDLFSDKKSSGIRLSSEMICHSGLILWSVLFAGILIVASTTVSQCTYSTHGQIYYNSILLDLVVVLGGTLLVVHLSRYYYNMFVRIGDVELLACKYSKKFIALRYHTNRLWERNPLDLLAVMVLSPCIVVHILYTSYGELISSCTFRRFRCPGVPAEDELMMLDHSRLAYTLDYFPVTLFARPIEHQRLTRDVDSLQP